MWSKVLKVSMFIYLIAAIFIGCYIGSELDSVGAGIGDNTAKMKKSMQAIKNQYYRQLGIVVTQYMNYSQYQNTQEQTNNK